MLDKKTIIKFIPDFWLYDIMMGCGSIWTKDKEIVIAVGTYKRRLPCGCPGSQYVQVRDAKGKKVYNEDIHIDDSYQYQVNNLQGKEWDKYWEAYYHKNPSRRPISIDNLIDSRFNY